MQVDYSCSDADLKAHFLGCGTVTRVTIPRDKFRGTPKGWVTFFFFSRITYILLEFFLIYLLFSNAYHYQFRFAYVEFANTNGRANAVAMAESLLKGRAIKVVHFPRFFLFFPRSISSQKQSTKSIVQVTEKRTNVRGLSTTNRFPSLNKVHRAHGGAIVKYVPVYAGRGAVRGRSVLTMHWWCL